MKKYFMVFITVMIAIFMYGCATTQKAEVGESRTQKVEVVDSSIGAWDYIIAGTPAGDISGTFVIGKEGENYTGSLEGGMLSGPLEDVTIVNSYLTGTIYYSGMALQLMGTFEGNSFSGAFSTSMGDFPMTAQKRQ